MIEIVVIDRHDPSSTVPYFFDQTVERTFVRHDMNDGPAFGQAANGLSCSVSGEIDDQRVLGARQGVILPSCATLERVADGLRSRCGSLKSPVTGFPKMGDCQDEALEIAPIKTTVFP